MRMRIKIATILIAIITNNAMHAAGQLKVDVSRFITLYNQGKYKVVFDEAYELRNRKEYGKIVCLDYFMAKALCAQKNFVDAKRGFNYILTQYQLNQAQKKFMLSEQNTCHNDELASVAGSSSLLTNFQPSILPYIPQAVVSGKLGYITNCQTDSSAYTFMPEFDREELQKRLFEIDQKEQAKKYYTDYLGNDYNIEVSGRYILITSKGYQLNSLNISKASNSLEKAYTFFFNYYGVRPPDKLIAVYLLQNKQKLSRTAEKVHGLILPASNIGYSSLEDLSILGNSDANNIGTIYHELFHLMIRTDVGDIPAWLDEGIACLYETSSFKGDSLIGNINNWRTDVLRSVKRVHRNLPTLSELVERNWDSFEINDINSPCDISVNYAVAKHFAIYMQQKGLLQKVMLGFKKRKNVFTDTLTENETNAMIIEKATGMPLSLLEIDFNNWLQSQYHIQRNYISLLEQFNITHEELNRYKYSSNPAITNSDEYQFLEKSYEEIKVLTKDFNIGEQDINIPTTVKKQINQYVTLALQFSKKHRLY